MFVFKSQLVHQTGQCTPSRGTESHVSSMRASSLTTLTLSSTRPHHPACTWKACNIKSVKLNTTTTWEMFQCDPHTLSKDFNYHFVAVSSIASPSVICWRCHCSPTMSNPSLNWTLSIQPITSEKCLDLYHNLLSTIEQEHRSWQHFSLHPEACRSCCCVISSQNY